MSVLLNMLSRLVITFLPRSSVQFSPVAQSCPTLCDPMNSSMPDLPNHHHLPEFTQTHVHWVGDAIQPSHPLLSPFSSWPQSFPASVFSTESTLCMRWPKYWSLRFSISPSSEHPGLISFRMDWLDLLAAGLLSDKKDVNLHMERAGGSILFLFIDEVRRRKGD